MLLRHLHNVHELLSVLAQPTAEMQRLREVLCEQGRFPTRRTWERRFQAIPATLPAQIGCLGRHLLDLSSPGSSADEQLLSIVPSCEPEEASGIRSIGNKENCPPPQLIPKPDFPKSGWHALVYGWKLHVISFVAAVWIPIAAVLTPAKTADSEPAPLC